ncbi:DUF6326 family protein [Erythrobacter sp. THAF29]|uniref:DUF6326 family protein n=1 Tax=Erythrobacter sp. THAF29 TaxID=2587851 RepID=UPI0012681807|nr:DUF6326 family protein [Erythrobacter sp. THAF29]QFT78187.1 hypothetical protein FIU90_11615 [Erythrobacter sp. THAF29]
MPSPFSDEQLGKTISLLWLFAILNTIFRDIHQLVVAQTIEEILAGQMNGNPVTESAMFAGAFAVELFLLGMLLSRLLKQKHARLFNLVVAPLAALGTFIAPPTDLDDYFFATVVLVTFGAIFALALKWRTSASAINRVTYAEKAPS